MKVPLLSVCLITYNQADYVSQAVDSILMQRLNVDWEIIIADDHSTDGTVEILTAYKAKNPDLIRLIIQEKNVGAVKNWTDLMEASEAKYIAYLEGDDYWTDRDKLAKEIDFLERNVDYALVCTDYDILNSCDDVITRNYLGTTYGLTRDHDISLKEYIFNRVAIRSLTVAMRREAVGRYFACNDSEITQNPSAGDLPLWLYILSIYKARYLPAVTAVYRVLPGTGSRPVDPHKKREFQKGVCDILEYFIRKNDLPASFFRKLKTQRILSDMEYEAGIYHTGRVIRMFFSLILSGVISRRGFYLVKLSLEIGRK